MNVLSFRLPVWTKTTPVYYWRCPAGEFPPHVMLYEAEGNVHIFAVPELEYPGMIKVLPTSKGRCLRW